VYDANGTNLGISIGVSYTGYSTFVTYYPALKGILTFQLTPTGDVQYGAMVALYFTSSDCTGDAYTASFGGGPLYTSPWIVQDYYTGTYFSLDPATASLDIQSAWYGYCYAYDWGILPAHKLIPITWPFATLAAPFSPR
jgi:hypothetical protein